MEQQQVLTEDDNDDCRSPNHHPESAGHPFGRFDASSAPCVVSSAHSEVGSGAAHQRRRPVKPKGSGPGRPLLADRRRPYTCSQCPSQFGSKMELEEHLNSHTGDKPFQCDICSARFNRRSTLWNHKRIHSNAKPFSCTVCQMTFKWKNSLKCHKEMHLRKNEQNPRIEDDEEFKRITYSTAKRENDPEVETEVNCAVGGGEIKAEYPEEAAPLMPVPVVEEQALVPPAPKKAKRRSRRKVDGGAKDVNTTHSQTAADSAAFLGTTLHDGRESTGNGYPPISQHQLQHHPPPPSSHQPTSIHLQPHQPLNYTPPPMTTGDFHHHRQPQMQLHQPHQQHQQTGTILQTSAAQQPLISQQMTTQQTLISQQMTGHPDKIEPTGGGTGSNHSSPPNDPTPSVGLMTEDPMQRHQYQPVYGRGGVQAYNQIQQQPTMLNTSLLGQPTPPAAPAGGYLASSLQSTAPTSTIPPANTAISAGVVQPPPAVVNVHIINHSQRGVSGDFGGPQMVCYPNGQPPPQQHQVQPQHYFSPHQQQQQPAHIVTSSAVPSGPPLVSFLPPPSVSAAPTGHEYHHQQQLQQQMYLQPQQQQPHYQPYAPAHQPQHQSLAGGHQPSLQQDTGYTPNADYVLQQTPTSHDGYPQALAYQQQQQQMMPFQAQQHQSLLPPTTSAHQPMVSQYDGQSGATAVDSADGFVVGKVVPYDKW